MTAPRWILLVLCVFALAAGCSRAPERPRPLSIEEFKNLSPAEQLSPVTFERLKQGNPTLETSEGWRAFERAVLRPDRSRGQSN